MSSKRAAGSALLLTLAFGVSPAAAGRLPAEGTWSFEKAGSTGKVVAFGALLHVEAGASTLDGVKGVVDAKCDSSARGSANFNVNASTKVDVKADGTFAATLKTIGDSKGAHGKVRLTGVIDGTRMSGKVQVTERHPAFGTCKGKGKFRAKGEQVG